MIRMEMFNLHIWVKCIKYSSLSTVTSVTVYSSRKISLLTMSYRKHSICFLKTMVLNPVTYVYVFDVHMHLEIALYAILSEYNQVGF